MTTEALILFIALIVINLFLISYAIYKKEKFYILIGFITFFAMLFIGLIGIITNLMTLL